MGFAKLAFVTGPATAPVTVLDLTGPTTNWLTAEDFSLGFPTWEAGPHAVGGIDGEREVAFTLKVIGSYTEAASAMQLVNRQLLAANNWLMVSWTAADKPMFLRTYRTQQDAVAWRYAASGVWDLPVKLTCDPFLYGSPVTVGPVTITNNPISGTNPAWYKFPTILGDAPTPLKIDLTPSAVWDCYSPLMATAALDTSPGAPAIPTGPYYWTAQGMTLGTNSSLVTGNANYIGSDYISTTPGGTLAASFVVAGAAPSSIVPGTYKVLARVGRSDLATTFKAHFGQAVGVGTNLSYQYGDVVSMTRFGSVTGSYTAWMDMGQFAFPIGAGGIDAADMGSAVTPQVAFATEVISGTGNTRLDGFLLIPVDTSATLDTAVAVTRFAGNGVDTTISGTWDGTKIPAQFRSYSSGHLSTIPPPRIDGRFLRVTPGAANVFHMVQQTKIDSPALAGENPDTIGRTAAVTFTYYPRYLQIRPEST